jgi:hypothetical protein
MQRVQAVSGVLRQELQRAEPGSERRVSLKVVVSPSADEASELVQVFFLESAPVEERVFSISVTSATASLPDHSPESGRFVAARLRQGRAPSSRVELGALHRGAELLSLELVDCATPSGTRPRAETHLDVPFSVTRVDASRARFTWGPSRPSAGPSDPPLARYLVRGNVDASSGSPRVTLLTVEGAEGQSHRAWVDGLLRFDEGMTFSRRCG